MDKYDELLARLDEAAGRIFGPGVFADAAAAIRELEAKLEAERKAREITADRAAENFSAAVEAGDRAEAAEQRLREEVAHLSQYSDTQFLAKVEAMERATEAEVKLHEVEAATIERCARTAETYNWIDDIRVQSPDEHQSAIVFAIRTLAPAQSGRGEPASSLVPGREREIGQLVLSKMISGNDVPVERCVITAAEISRLKGEGSDHE